MSTVKRRTIIFFISILLSYISLFILGNLDDIIAYENIAHISKYKLILLQSSLFFVMTLTNSYILFKIIQMNKNIFKSIFFVGIADIVFISHVVSIGIYIQLGDYLRDIHGINWYTMDWAGWAITFGIFFLSVFGAILLFLTGRLFSKKPRELRNTKRLNQRKHY